ncbi:hypothetical protein J2W56_002685 [Nocardia kruczakiae]|uniref:Uncharacterized protein n=1 Tax=Nocardia kruczakiae TaxID=261477 RepID=A0ABU1XEH9_9NOCA|nr:hypothetical protein [Nocardia kruczakiae]MDR7168944.1 hypothetical protein [Nocardia kruczakiae]
MNSILAALPPSEDGPDIELLVIVASAVPVIGSLLTGPPLQALLRLWDKRQRLRERRLSLDRPARRTQQLAWRNLNLHILTAWGLIATAVSLWVVSVVLWMGGYADGFKVISTALGGGVFGALALISAQGRNNAQDFAVRADGRDPDYDALQGVLSLIPDEEHRSIAASQVAQTLAQAIADSMVLEAKSKPKESKVRKLPKVNTKGPALEPETPTQDADNPKPDDDGPAEAA